MNTVHTWKIGYITASNDLVFKTIEAVTRHEAIVKCMQADPTYRNSCYSDCLTYKAPSI